MSSLRHAPISKQEYDWQRIGQCLTAQNSLSKDLLRAKESGLDNGKVLIICGKTDPVIVFEELMEDTTKVLRVDNVRFETFDTGLELLLTKAQKLWNMRGIFGREVANSDDF